MFQIRNPVQPLSACLMWMAVVASVASMPHSVQESLASDLANVAASAGLPSPVAVADSVGHRHFPRSFFKRRTMSKRDSTAGNSASKSGFLKVVEAPPKLLEARQHGKVVLACSASGKPAPEITWYKDGKPLYGKIVTNEVDYAGFSPESLSETKSRVEIDCVSQEDAGLYECVARNDKKTVTLGTELNVVSYDASTACLARRLAGAHHRSAPRVNQWMGTYMQVLGTEAHLICRTEEGDRAKTYWVGPDDEAIEDAKVVVTGGKKYEQLSNGDLIIRNLSFSDMGMFKCIVRNDFGEDMKETFVYPHAR